ncbi:sugar transferase [Nocardioides astragali]|uniref:Sugar transferase n=1 Tax=Nocardioides astragali TaxID=1776736 RepID=A0ABW2N0K1_9ACTN|nr:sugar transferase [Nocardioides astragali]
MTQVTARTHAPRVSSPTIPRPRAAGPSAPDVAAQVAPAETPSSVRRHQTSWPVVAVDTALSLALALAATAFDLLAMEVAVATSTIWVLVSSAAGHYRKRELGESRGSRFRLVLGTGVRIAVLVLATSPWLTTIDPVALSQLVAALSVASAVHLLVAVRRRRPRVVLAGRPRDVRDAMLEMEANDNHDLVAVCLTRTSKVPTGDLPTYLGFDASPSAARQHQADAVVVLPGSRLTPAEVRRLDWALTGVGTQLYVGTCLLDVTPVRTRVFATGGLTLVRAVPPSMGGPRRWVKEVVERVAATIGLALLLPALLVIGLLIRIDSPGPAIYRQLRVGRDGRLFTMYKFRSMSSSADAERTELVPCNEADGVLFKIKQDPRVTGLGRWLRRTSIDEVPQLWNVIRGDMSLVGPRPALPDEVARYDTDPRRRLVVKPGMTGLWQVSGRSDLSWAESVRLDVRYVDNWSLGLDLAILARTVKAVLNHRGAY